MELAEMWLAVVLIDFWSENVEKQIKIRLTLEIIGGRRLSKPQSTTFF